MHKIGQSGGFLGKILRPLLKIRLPLIGNVLKSLAKSALIPLGLKAEAPATDAAIYKNIFRPGYTTLIIYNEEMNDIVKIVALHEESGLVIKVVSESIKSEVKEQIGRFLEMLLGIIDSSLLGNLWTGERISRAGKGTFRAGEGTVRAVQDL